MFNSFIQQPMSLEFSQIKVQYIAFQQQPNQMNSLHMPVSILDYKPTSINKQLARHSQLIF